MKNKQKEFERWLIYGEGKMPVFWPEKQVEYPIGYDPKVGQYELEETKEKERTWDSRKMI